MACSPALASNSVSNTTPPVEALQSCASAPTSTPQPRGHTNYFLGVQGAEELRTTGIDRWRVLVVLDGHAEAKARFDLKTIPSHFLLEMKPLTTHRVTAQELVHMMIVRLKLPDSFPLTARYWDALVRKFQPITDATVDPVLDGILNMLVTNTYLDSSGLVRAGAYISLKMDYELFHR